MFAINQGIKKEILTLFSGIPEQCCYQSLHVCSGLSAKYSYFQIMDIYQNKQTYLLHSRQGEGKEQEGKQRLRKRGPYIYLFI